MDKYLLHVCPVYFLVFNYYNDVMLFSLYLSLTGIWKTTEFNSFPATFLR